MPKRPLESVLRTKLRPPVSGSVQVERLRLHALLDELARSPLTTVVAPAGSGKTSLLSAWSAGRRRAWLSLDDTDRDVVQFWAEVIAALEAVAPGCGGEAGEQLLRPGAVRGAVDALLSGLAESGSEATVLVLDDAGALRGSSLVAETMTTFVSHLPPWLRVVMASRTMPDLPVSRLRARGLLRELHYADLRFDPTESITLLRTMAPQLPDDLLLLLSDSSGGWAAGLQLSALAARSTSSTTPLDPDVPSWHRNGVMNDYVWDDVLAEEDPAVVEVLLATSVVERVDGELARHLTGREDAPLLLERARERGLFINPLEADGYEVHDIVRSALQRELGRRIPGRVEHQHARAAGWFEAHGQVSQALEHWLAAGLPRQALRLLADRCAQLYDSGREATIRRTIERISPAVTGMDAEASVEFAWCHLLVDTDRFRELVDELVASYESARDYPETLARHIDMLRSMAETGRGNWARGGELAARTAAALGPAWSVDPLGRFAWNMVARDIALSGRWDDTSADVRRVVQALSLAPERRVTFEGSRAIGLVLAGRPADAIRVAAEVRASAEVAHLSMLLSEISIAEALARREIGDREGSTRELRALVGSRPGPVPYTHLLAWLALTESTLDEGDVVGARKTFDLAAEFAGRVLPGSDASSLLAATGVRLALAMEAVDDAWAWSERIDDDFWRPASDARVLLASGRRDEAWKRLTSADRGSRERPLSDRQRVVRALLLHRASPDPSQREKCLAEATDLAAARGMVQTVASEGVSVAAAVEKLAWRVPDTWVMRVRTAAQTAQRRAGLAGLNPSEPLTDRELEVLRLLPTTLTLREIGDKLFISADTVKSHTRAIYRKLGCATRPEVVERLRALGY